jgi:hypothetical protein
MIIIKIPKYNKKIKLIQKNNVFFIKGPLGILKFELDTRLIHFYKKNKFFIFTNKLKNLIKQIKTLFYGLCTG